MESSDFLGRVTRILFFTGKGGVGKTSLAAATGVALAGRGKRVLLVSTDPASNLDEVLGVSLSGVASAIPGASGLFALNIDPEAAAAAYRDQVIGPFRGVLPPSAIASMEEQLSGACTVEIAAFDQFTKLLGDPEATADFDHLLFDTAPTGHTIRLLNLPAAWTGFIAANRTGTSCLGPLAALESQKALYAASLRVLSDESQSTVVLVARPERSALEEAKRTRSELAGVGMRNQMLVINGTFAALDRSDAAALALQSRCQDALVGMPEALSELPRLTVPLSATPPVGVSGLAALFDNNSPLPSERRPATSSRRYPGLNDLIHGIERDGRGVILTMGKGGVGKTTVAAAIAVELANRGHSVHLSTTDPAAHLLRTVREQIRGLRVSRIDPTVETSRYVDEVLRQSALHLDAEGLALLEEDLRSPCTEEIAVFRAFAETVAGHPNEYVVLDTAPTGHTLLLLDAAEAYHREVTRQRSEMPDAVRQLLPRLRDPEVTRIILVTHPEATPVHEAARLQTDLKRAGISVYAWVVNQSLSACSFSDPLLAHRGALEMPFITEVESTLAARIAVVPWTALEPIGPERLRSFAQASGGPELVNACLENQK